MLFASLRGQVYLAPSAKNPLFYAAIHLCFDVGRPRLHTKEVLPKTAFQKGRKAKTSTHLSLWRRTVKEVRKRQIYCWIK